MSDTIGRISVPALVDSGLTFPLTSDFGYGFTQERPVVVHQFGELDAKAEQRFAVGLGPRKFAFRRQHLSMRDRNSLVSFWEGLQERGSRSPTTSPIRTRRPPPQRSPGSTPRFRSNTSPTPARPASTSSRFRTPAAPTYTVNSTCVRFPSSALQTALLSQVQQIIPLIHIRVRESAVPDIYLSDRRCTVGGQLYLPRVLGLGEPGSSVILTQDIKGTADSVRFTFGNADRAMTALANDTDLKYAADRPLALPCELRHPDPIVGRIHHHVHERRQPAVLRPVERRALPDHPAISGARHLADLLEALQQVIDILPINSILLK